MDDARGLLEKPIYGRSTCPGALRQDAIRYPVPAGKAVTGGRVVEMIPTFHAGKGAAVDREMRAMPGFSPANEESSWPVWHTGLHEVTGLQAREHFEALQSARRHQETEVFRESYAARAGIEGTHSQAIGRCGLRQCRSIGLAKTRLQHFITAALINLV